MKAAVFRKIGGLSVVDGSLTTERGGMGLMSDSSMQKTERELDLNLLRKVLLN